jgi:hypothetical protein
LQVGESFDELERLGLVLEDLRAVATRNDEDIKLSKTFDGLIEGCLGFENVLRLSSVNLFFVRDKDYFEGFGLW